MHFFTLRVAKEKIAKINFKGGTSFTQISTLVAKIQINSTVNIGKRKFWKLPLFHLEGGQRTFHQPPNFFLIFS